VKEQYRNASILKSGRVVFNIAGNKYRLVVHINFTVKVIYIRFIGTSSTTKLIGDDVMNGTIKPIRSKSAIANTHWS